MIQLIVFDMAGTTVRDQDEVLHCFREACIATQINAPDTRLNALMGVSKLEVFTILWREQLPTATDQEIAEKADNSYIIFKEILETYYRTQPVEPTEGTLSVFEWCRSNHIKIALNTGFYRAVADIILERLDWKIGVTIDDMIASDEVAAGRPQPDMIRALMARAGVSDSKNVVKIGDTPVDLLEGRQANCLLSLAVTNGTHTAEELFNLDYDALLSSLAALPDFLETYID